MKKELRKIFIIYSGRFHAVVREEGVKLTVVLSMGNFEKLEKLGLG